MGGFPAFCGEIEQILAPCPPEGAGGTANYHRQESELEEEGVAGEGEGGGGVGRGVEGAGGVGEHEEWMLKEKI